MDEARHCDDYIDDETQPEALRRFLRFKRWPATYQFKASSMGVETPTLFATLQTDICGQSFHGHGPDGPIMKQVSMKRGDTVRVVMASRFGDVGITPNLQAEHGYVARVDVDQLDDFTASDSEARHDR